MAGMDQVRQQFPQYNDLSDAQLMSGLYKKYYSDVPIQGFVKKLMTDYGMGMDQVKEFSSLANAQGADFNVNTQLAPEVGGKAGGMGRGLLQGMTMGASDEITAGGVAALRKVTGDDRPISDIYGQELTQERGRLGQFRETNPVLAYGSEIAGGIAAPLGAATSVKGAAALGGGLGAVSGALTSEGDMRDRATGALTGGVLGALLGGGLHAASGGITSTFEDYMTKRAAKAVAEGADSVQKLRDEANAAYAAARNSGASIDPQAYQQLIDDVTSKIAGGAGRQVHKELTPKSAYVLSSMKDMVGKSVGIDDMEYIRQLAQNPAGMVTDKAEQRAASLIINGIDDFMGSIDATKVVSDPTAASAAVGQLTKARDLWGRMRRTEKIQNIIDVASSGRYAGGFESGIKTQIGSLLGNAKARRGFSKDELSLLVNIQKGTPIGRVLAGISYLGFSPSGGRSGLLTSGGVWGTLGLSGSVWPAAAGVAATTALRILREKSLAEQANIYAQIIASGKAGEVAQKLPSVMRYLQGISAAATRGSATQLPSDILNR
jgi:hypothetical protein